MGSPLLEGLLTALALATAGCALAPAAPRARPRPHAAFYVAPDGDDRGPGTWEKPFATLARARDAVRALPRPREAPVVVVLRGGTYTLDEPVVFGPQDSGTAASPVRYVAQEGERPVLSGGRRVGPWEVEEAGVYVTILPEVREGAWDFRHLFVRRRGRDYFERRYRPMVGAFVTAGLTDSPAHETRMRHRQSQRDFIYREGDIRPDWANIGDVEVVALHDWSASRLRIESIDPERRVVAFTGRPVYRIGHWYGETRNPYYVENVREAFGEPGRWYLDRPTGELSYRPLPDERMDELAVVAPRLAQLVCLEGDAAAGRFVEHLAFEGIHFRHTDWDLPPEGYSSGQGMVDLPAAFHAQGARHVALERCTFANLGAYAIRLGEGCSECSVVGCHLYDLGGGGVLVGVTRRQAEPPELPVDNAVANCVISDGARDHFAAHGIWVGIAQDTRLRHNVVRRFLYSTVSLGWSWNPRPTSCRGSVAERNHIHDAMMLLADGGGIYTLGFQPGTALRGNHIHAVHRSRFAGRAPNNGVFLDQGSKGFLIEGNVIYDTAQSPIRFNQCRREWHTWRDNALGIAPDDPRFPAERAARAGLETAYRDVDRPVEVSPVPLLAMPLPPPPPAHPIVDDFESTPLGRRPRRAAICRESGQGTVRVSDEAAASGARSLKFTDAAGLAKPFYPYLSTAPQIAEGVARVALAVRLEAGAELSIDGRREAHSVVGPRVVVAAGGQLVAAGRAVCDVPPGRWLRLAIVCPVGEARTGTWSLSVEAEGGEAKTIEGLPLASDRFDRLGYVVLTSGAERETAFYIDDLRIARE
ncbi:MAG: right-handed parallel beta-helix repeat-containing protein [Candidatus Brocadiia bacterium]